MSGLTLLLVCLVAAGGSRIEGFSSLRLKPGVREAGMGGVGVASGFGPQAIALNPAANATLSGFAAAVQHTSWILDMSQQSAFVARRTPLFNVGAGAVAFSAGRFEYRTDPTLEPMGTFQPVELSAYLNLARTFLDGLDVGVTGRYFYAKTMTDIAAGVGADLGMRWRPTDRLAVGLSLIDFGQKLSFRREVFRLPTRLRAGASYSLLTTGQLGILAAADGSWYFLSRRPELGVGFELSFRELLMARVGYNLPGGAQSLGFGLGLKVRGLRFDYAVAPLRRDLGWGHRFSVGLGQ